MVSDIFVLHRHQIVYDNLHTEVQKKYDWFVKQIEEDGFDEKFYQSTFRYRYVGDMKYWVHGFDVTVTVK
jgi:hypothetical protein